MKRTLTGLLSGIFLLALPLAAAERWSIGLTANDAPIEAIVVEGVAGPSTAAPTVLLLGGLQGTDDTVDVVKQEAATFDALPQARRPFRLIAVPLANPDGRPLQFPPTGNAYKVYGHEFGQPTYISAMALIAQLRLGNTTEVLKLADPYLNGTTDSFARPSQSSLAAHLLFYEIARRTSDERAAKLVIRAANSGFTDDGSLREFMPLHGGWSDSVFMDIPILAKAGTLTGERKYFDMAARHFLYMQKIVGRADGLYRHQASTDAAWGRGNGFPALGLALTLTDFPKDHPDYAALLAAFRKHMQALSQFQDENGMFREVIDYPGAYPEYSGTVMIATAMMRGIRKGWLEASVYQPAVDRAWRAILARTASDGRLFDVAESTGTRGLTFKDYLRRGAILDRDPRGGAFAMILATEIAGVGVEF